MSVLAARLVCTAALLVLLPFSARADVLQLANGDRLHGRLVARENGTIRWESPLLGLVSVAENQASVLPEVGSSAPATAAIAPAATPTASAPTSPPQVVRWKSKIESGFTLQSGRSDRADVNLRFETAFEHKRNSYLAQARYLYSKADGATTSDRTEGAIRWRRELDPHWFGQTNTTYLSSKIKGIDHNAEQNIGLGYRLLKTPRTSATLGAGATGQYREISGAGSGCSLFGEIFQDFAIKLSPRLDLGEDAKAQYSPSGRGIRLLPNGQVQIIDTSVTNYKLTFNSYLRGKFTETLSLALRYEYEYDNTYVSGTVKSDQRITTTLGYTF